MNLKIRYPGLTYKKRQLSDQRLYRVVYRCNFFVVLSPNVLTFNFTQDVEDNLKRVQGVLVNDDEGAQHLDSEYQWQVWKRDMKSLTKQDHYELAIFLYCTLNRELEHEYENGHFHYEFNVH